MRIYIRPKRYTVDDYIHIDGARRYCAIDGPRLWRGGIDIETLAGRYRPANISKSKQDQINLVPSITS
jgi:hypothetical protein